MSNLTKKILISGASGFVGRSLTKTLKANGNFDVYTLVRKPAQNAYEIQWDPEKSTLDTNAFNNVQPDIVVNLAGENIFGFWTEDKKRRILESRTKGTKLLSDASASLTKPPLFICASGCTFYGTNVDQPTDENAPKGEGFFANVVEHWEQSCQSMRDVNGRVVNLRFGIVVDPSGGFLQMVYYPFYFGLGGVMGSGNQWFPWVSLEDTVRIIQFAIDNPNVSGPINVASPNPVTNTVLTKTLGRVLNRPTFFWMPEILINTIFGKEMATETILSSQRVLPHKLMDYGYQFVDVDLEKTLRKQLLK